MQRCNMARPKSKSKFSIIKKSNSQFWYAKFFSEKDDKIVRKSTGYSRREYTKEEVQCLFDIKVGDKAKDVKHSIKWLENLIIFHLKTEGRAEKTIEGYERAFKTLTEIYGSDYSIHEIGRSTIRKVKALLQEKGNRNATINICLKNLSAAFNYAYLEEEVINRNPFCRYHPLDKQKDKQKAFTLDELKCLLKVLDTHSNKNLKHLLRISIFTGLRRSEVLHIKREDVNLNERYYWRINNKSSDKRKLMQVITDDIYNDFAYFMSENPGSPYPFKVIKPNSYTQATKRLFRKYGFPEDLHLHSCRHTAITRALESGMSMREVQKAVDHSSILVTEIYGHEETKKPLKLGLD